MAIHGWTTVWTLTALALICCAAKGGDFNQYGSEGPATEPDLCDDDGFGRGFLSDSSEPEPDPFSDGWDYPHGEEDEYPDWPQPQNGTQPQPQQAPQSRHQSDPLPGHPAGQHGSAARERVLATWHIISDWVKIPTKVSNRKPKDATAAKEAADAELRQDIDSAAALSTPCIPCPRFAGAVAGYKFCMVDKTLGYHLDTPPAHDPEPGTPASQQALSVRPTVHISDLLQRSTVAEQPPPKQTPRPRKWTRARFQGPLLPASPTDSLESRWWKDQGLWAIDTLNPNSFNSTGSQNYRTNSHADAIILQETKAGSVAQQHLKTDAQSSGWNAVSTAAREGRRNGRSGGAAVLVRNSFNADHSPGLALTAEPHRAVFADTSICGGTTLISLYLRQGEGMSPGNRTILEETAAEISSLDTPWIIGMDANMSPADLQKSGWVDMIKGQIIAPEIPTCSSSTLDFFVVSKQLVPAVHAVQVIQDVGTSPHQPVRLLIQAGAARRFRRQIAKPPLVPGKLPLGPMDERTQRDY